MGAINCVLVMLRNVSLSDNCTHDPCTFSMCFFPNSETNLCQAYSDVYFSWVIFPLIKNLVRLFTRVCVCRTACVCVCSSLEFEAHIVIDNYPFSAPSDISCIIYMIYIVRWNMYIYILLVYYVLLQINIPFPLPKIYHT